MEAELNEANNSPIDVFLSLPVFGFAASFVRDQLRYRGRRRVVRPAEILSSLPKRGHFTVFPSRIYRL